jgi:Homeodomain-like domain
MARFTQAGSLIPDFFSVFQQPARPMRPPAKIKPWLSLPQLTEWVCAAAADTSLLRKRLVVWLMALQPRHARQVATLLGVSVVSVWRWVGRYNRGGPQALSRPKVLPPGIA